MCEGSIRAAPIPTDESLKALIAPASVAVIGASADRGRVGGRLFAYLAEHFPGQLAPVNPGHQIVQGVPAAASVSDLGFVPDLAVLCVPAAAAVDEAQLCASLGVKALLVVTAGFAEVGAEGVELQRRLQEIVERTGVRVLGPNCLGLVNVASGLVATFSDLSGLELTAGPVALVSQSGAFGAQVFRRAQRSGLGVGRFYSTGNEVDVTVTDLVAHLIERSDVDMVLAVLESIRQPELLLECGRRARQLGKPFLCLKLGVSSAGVRAALSHTGTIAGSDAAVDAAFRTAGILRPRRMDQLLDWARVLRQQARPAGRRLGIVTTSGGVGILLSDAAAASRLDVPVLPEPEQDALRGSLPSFASSSNPIDCTGQIVNDLGILRGVLATLAASDSIDLLCVAGLPDEVSDPWLDALMPLAAFPKPVVVWCGTQPWVARLTSLGIPAVDDPTAAIESLAALERYAASPALANLAPLDRMQSNLNTGMRGTLLEPEAASLLAAYGIELPAMRVVADADQAIQAAEALGYPVAVKVLAADLVHRSDAGGVRIDLRAANDVADAVRAVVSSVQRAAPDTTIAGVLVQRMAASGTEMMLGARRDPAFGPVVSVGLGGVLVEILASVASRLAPLDPDQAMDALAELNDGRLVTSPRGLRADGQERLAHMMVALGRLMTDHPEILEVDLNPVIVTSNGDVVAVDALIVNGGVA